LALSAEVTRCGGERSSPSVPPVRSGVPPRDRRGALGLALVASLLAAAGCTSLRSGSDTCGTAGLNCQADADVDPGEYDFTCLVSPPMAPMMTPAINYTTRVVNYSTHMFPPGLVACVCSTGDPVLFDPDASIATPCYAPIGGGCVQGPSDGGDTITIPLPAYDSNLGGYVYVTFEAPGLLPVAVWFNTPSLVDIVGAPPVTLFDLTTISFLAKQVLPQNETLDPTKALVVVTSHDCKGRPVAGAHAALTPQGSDPPVQFVFLTGVASLDVEGGTDITGQYGFANVPVGGTTVTATAYYGGLQIGPSGAVITRLGWGTAIAVLP
jgi:hypothetical protein